MIRGWWRWLLWYVPDISRIEGEKLVMADLKGLLVMYGSQGLLGPSVRQREEITQQVASER
jgi:hypothetical protein